MTLIKMLKWLCVTVFACTRSHQRQVIRNLWPTSMLCIYKQLASQALQ